MFNPDNFIKVGTFLKPHGHLGDIKMKASTALLDFIAHRLDIGNPLLFLEMQKKPVPFFMQKFHISGAETAILKLEDIDSEDEARGYRDCSVMLPLDEVPQELIEEPGNFDLAGFRVESVSGEIYGEIEAVLDNSLQQLLQINYQGRELLIPVHQEFILNIDYSGHKVIVDLPAEFLES